MPHTQIRELQRAACEVAEAVAVARRPGDGELCPCGLPAVIVFVTRDGRLPFCGLTHDDEFA